MGMDVYGLGPKNETGEYFRNNVWWWKPLADYCLNEHGDIADGCEHWHSNDGDGLDEDGAMALAERLRSDIESGRAAEHERKYNEWRASLPRQACEFCNCTGIRDDKVGLEMGMPEKELEEEMKILTGRTHGWCNACDGAGTVESWGAAYPFSVDNLREFAAFLESCGGFQIC
jgi:hypothetical protein